MSVLIDSYSESNYSALYGTSEDNTIGQTFTGTTSTLSSCKFYLKRTSGTEGVLTARLYAHTGTYGVSGEVIGSPLAISDEVSISSLGTDFSLVEFVFSGSSQYKLKSEYYVMVVYRPTGASTVYLGADSSSPTHSGNLVETNNIPDADADAIFYVYGTEPTPTVGTKYPLPAFKVA